MRKLLLFLISILICSSLYAGHYEFAGDGSRGKAMGGAFVALADDATAYSWNPAGMVLLQKPEFSFMARMRDQNYRTFYPYNPQGNVWGQPTYVFSNWHDAIKFDTTNNRNIRGASNGNIPMLNYVYPWEKIAIGFGLNILFDYSIVKSTQASGNSPVYLQDINKGLSWEKKNEREQQDPGPSGGVAVAFSLGRSLSVGFGIAGAGVNNLNTNKSREEYFPAIASPGNTITNPYYNSIDFGSESGNPTMLAYSAGILYRPIPELSFGLVYKDSIPTKCTLKSWFVGTGGDKYSNPLADDATGYVTVDSINFKYPQFIGTGLAFRMRDVFTISTQVNHIAYSQMDYDPNDNWIFEDAIEYHIGAEYVFFLGKEKDILFPLRFGYYLEPSAQDFYKWKKNPYSGSYTWTADDTRKMTEKYGKDADQHHITFGTGFAREQWSFDFTVDYCERRIDIMFTPVFYF